MKYIVMIFFMSAVLLTNNILFKKYKFTITKSVYWVLYGLIIGIIYMSILKL